MMVRRAKKYKKLTSLILLVLLILYINIFPPTIMLTILGFYFLWILFWLNLLANFVNLKINFIWTMTVTLILILKQLKLLSVTNMILIGACFMSLTFYFRKNVIN